MSNLQADEKLIERIEEALGEADKLKTGIEAALETGFFRSAMARAAKQISTEIGNQAIFGSIDVKTLRDFAENLARAADSECRRICIQDEYGIGPPRTEEVYSETGSELLVLRSLALVLADRINAVRWLLDARRIAAELLESC
ncbi:hypothetical protein [Maliponia aquimaris]|uniref:Uncharacterized protein n=1 Tax=Maliponia aquimaris TaxID=1673631 RepID=A0A238L4Z4_9RHOB|nr:hypothetical protein [Maliponia aquimaris]SMX49920.1 hypothetical protein MAA8898_04506 [Maliponia aquimaris]